MNSGFGIFTSISGTAPNRIFNIEWRAQYFPGSGSANFELRLYQGLSRFDVIYGTVSNSNTSATAGVQRDDSTFVQDSATAQEVLLLVGKAISCSLVELHHQRNANGYRHCHSNSNRHANGDCDGHSDGDSNGHAISYSYTKTHSNPETPSHTKATSDPTASPVTGNTRPAIFRKQAERNYRGENMR